MRRRSARGRFAIAVSHALSVLSDVSHVRAERVSDVLQQRTAAASYRTYKCRPCCDSTVACRLQQLKAVASVQQDASSVHRTYIDRALLPARVYYPLLILFFNCPAHSSEYESWGSRLLNNLPEVARSQDLFSMITDPWKRKPRPDQSAAATLTHPTAPLFRRCAASRRVPVSEWALGPLTQGCFMSS